MTYVISDIHGEYNKFMTLLEKIQFSDADTLYVLGDVVDRGPKPMECLLYMMEHANIIPIAGNHELMALTCLPFLLKEVTEDSLAQLDLEMWQKVFDWQLNGNQPTLSGFKSLDPSTRNDVLEYMGSFDLYAEVAAGDKTYLLVHAGLGNFSPDRPLDDYDIDELVWERPDYGMPYFDDIYTVTGHTPTFTIEENKKPGYIYRVNHHIAIDCGACFPGGRLAALCLDTGEEFYSDN